MLYRNDPESFNEDIDEINNEFFDQYRHHHHHHCGYEGCCVKSPVMPYYPNYLNYQKCPTMYGYQAQSMTYGSQPSLMRDEEDSYEEDEDFRYPYYQPYYPYHHPYHPHHKRPPYYHHMPPWWMSHR